MIDDPPSAGILSGKGTAPAHFPVPPPEVLVAGCNLAHGCEAWRAELRRRQREAWGKSSAPWPGKSVACGSRSILEPPSKLLMPTHEVALHKVKW